MDRVWEFIRQKRNREILGWLGGGIAVLASGIWAMTVYFFPPHKTRDAKPAEIEARCGVAVGGNVSGSNIAVGTTSGADCSVKPK